MVLATDMKQVTPHLWSYCEGITRSLCRLNTPPLRPHSQHFSLSGIFASKVAGPAGRSMPGPDPTAAPTARPHPHPSRQDSSRMLSKLAPLRSSQHHRPARGSDGCGLGGEDDGAAAASSLPASLTLLSRASSMSRASRHTPNMVGGSILRGTSPPPDTTADVRASKPSVLLRGMFRTGTPPLLESTAGMAEYAAGCSSRPGSSTPPSRSDSPALLQPAAGGDPTLMRVADADASLEGEGVGGGGGPQPPSPRFVMMQSSLSTGGGDGMVFALATASQDSSQMPSIERNVAEAHPMSPPLPPVWDDETQALVFKVGLAGEMCVNLRDPGWVQVEWVPSFSHFMYAVHAASLTPNQTTDSCLPTRMHADCAQVL